MILNNVIGNCITRRHLNMGNSHAFISATSVHGNHKGGRQTQMVNKSRDTHFFRIFDGKDILVNRPVVSVRLWLDTEVT